MSSQNLSKPKLPTCQPALQLPGQFTIWETFIKGEDLKTFRINKLLFLVKKIV